MIDLDELEALAEGADMHTEETAWLNGNEHLPVPYPSQVLALIAEVRRARKIREAAKEIDEAARNPRWAGWESETGWDDAFADLRAALIEEEE
jgi:hypothetical protein